MLFFIPNLVVLAISGNWNVRTVICFAMITIWSWRLAIHIFSRHTNGEDFRYQDMRNRWEAHGKCYYYTFAFTFIFMM